ncbi:paraquat-inducible protein A [Sulfitobacter mediterraneus]|jgi:paraquat-inducible protein A|uniref:Paraquat-inducible protein A n=1 Tax=Sulfitobacter mediterraneus TaxID=83219 RepID=A0A2T6CEC2_9RHOB|nr:paraquat-inducible protein A [Sulfitobacter mediterraneus]MBM1308708.1 paraquat-inducible protein A [Sulfitobacter mediterraneus]MBM1312593.1 paraquat-inducible protein A [Sulfitobacter mediterraneus]MBM1320974.1 paraquat-inducible protein A [Sulfitobacter mediterraneus]MBM1324862.1 paraquat-inducible protein A [Sulfitobacter mediterraneus]MBM1396208.1 paraquat-inducible protein A [Sulfitobacter mediterraneus]
MVCMELSGTPKKIVSARDLGIVACSRCSKAWPLGTQTCARCGHALVSRDPMSLQRVWAYWVMGLICYVPANLFPMLQTRTLFQVDESTIIGGAVELAHHGNLGIAAIIIFASVVIPLGKFWAVAFLALSVKNRSMVSKNMRQFLYEVVEYIGRWSMIDIFVVAILSSLVQLKALAAINPGTAAMFFALSVIFTMLSAQAFDSRLIWDVQAKDKSAGDGGAEINE